MNRASIAIVVGIALAGIACTQVSGVSHHHRHPSHHGHPGHLGHRVSSDQDDDIEQQSFFPHPHHDGGFHHNNNPLNFVSDEQLFEELFKRGHLSHHGHQGPSISGRKPLRPTFGRHGKSGGIGGTTSLDSSKEISAAGSSSTKVGGKVAGENHKGSLIGASQTVDFGNREEKHDDLEGVHKHQVSGHDQTIIKNKDLKVNDVDGFRKSTGGSKTNILSTGNKQVAAQEESGRFEGSANLSNEQEGSIDASSDVNASGSAGAGIEI